MFSITILGSGSAGNCAVVETRQCRLLIDGGLSARQISLRLAAAGVDPGQLDGILVTHEHIDHIGGLHVLSKKIETPIYCNRLTAEVMQKSGFGHHKNWRIFTTGGEFAVGDIAVQTFPVPHDAADPVGFMLCHGSSSLGFCTDLGFATKLVYERIREAETLVIETNHDEKMLQNDPRRPWAVKQRIMSRHGHLSNAAAASVLVEILGNKLRRAILGHLSRDCNSPETAVATVRSRLEEAGERRVEVFCASQSEISPRFELGAG
jgi:phosphoribosyl 1,2-cyclic phosphodiesterase